MCWASSHAFLSDLASDLDRLLRDRIVDPQRDVAADLARADPHVGCVAEAAGSVDVGDAIAVEIPAQLRVRAREARTRVGAEHVLATNTPVLECWLATTVAPEEYERGAHDDAGEIALDLAVLEPA